jgi:hypothetical protein
MFNQYIIIISHILFLIFHQLNFYYREAPIRSFVNTQQQDEPKNASLIYDTSTHEKIKQCQHVVFNKCNEQVFTPNYETSTLASRLKRSSRSNFNRFNFHNIPFVVGTSVTPSHNLGLNIQQVSHKNSEKNKFLKRNFLTQVLNIMKTKQPVVNNITPLLIRKVNRGMRPSIILEQINDEKSFLNVNSQITGIFNNRENLCDNRDKKLSIFNLQDIGKTQNVRSTMNAGNTKMISAEEKDICKQVHQKKNDFVNENRKIKQQSVINKRNVSANIRNQQNISRQSLNKVKSISAICVKHVMIY